jgi:hypothetical protein
MYGGENVADSDLQEISKSRIPSSKMVLPKLARLAILVAMDASAIWYLYKLLSLGYYPLAAVTLIIVIFVNVVLLHQQAYPIRWMVVGLVLMTMFTIYPIFFTVWVSFTNYGEGHLITKRRHRPDFKSISPADWHSPGQPLGSEVCATLA